MTQFPSRPSNMEFLRATDRRTRTELDEHRKILKNRIPEGGVMLFARAGSVSTTNNTYKMMGVGGSSAWDTLFDPSEAQVSGTTERFNFLLNGWYNMVVNMEWDANTTGERSLRVLKNGTAVAGLDLQWPAASNIADNMAVPGLIFVNGTTDYLEFQVKQTSGGSLTLQTFIVQLRFSHRA